MKTDLQSQLVTIEKPVYGGSFLARIEGKALFVPLVLPDEEARIRITESKSGYATAEAEAILNASPQRIAPACTHFGICGGCHYQHSDYPTQLAFKRAILRETLERGGVAVPEEIVVLAGEAWHSRNRIRLAFDAAGNPGYRGRHSHTVTPIRECLIAAPILIKAALATAEIVRQLSASLKPVEIALFTNAEESALQMSLFVANAKKHRFADLAEVLAERVPALKGAELLLQGRANEMPRIVARWGQASIAYRAANFEYRVDHGAFFQVNRWLVDALVELVLAAHKGVLAWDLYAGVGLFARQLTTRFERVIAVESAPSATQALAANLKESCGIPVRATTLDYLQRFQNQQNTATKTPDLIVVDPPRTGLGAETTALLAAIQAQALAYVSCDPATLARDLRLLVASGYQMDTITLADLFPQTYHLETVVQLRR